jgi:hypothetical protein
MNIDYRLVKLIEDGIGGNTDGPLSDGSRIVSPISPTKSWPVGG